MTVVACNNWPLLITDDGSLMVATFLIGGAVVLTPAPPMGTVVV